MTESAKAQSRAVIGDALPQLIVADTEKACAYFRDRLGFTNVYEGAGAIFVQCLTVKPWGAKDFIIKDIDGNLLLFAGP